MKADMEKLKRFSKEKDISFATMAESIGVHLSTFYRKVESEGENFTIGEVHKMVANTPMTRTEAISIFLPEYSK